MQEAVSMLFQSKLVSEPLLLEQSQQASPQVREFSRDAQRDNLKQRRKKKHP
jgi:hypothetical protein